MVTHTTELTAREAPRLLSLIIPIYNERAVLPHLRAALESWCATLGGLPVEFVLVNDGSSDGSLTGLETWAAERPEAKVVSFSRNFGHQAAVAAGLRYARGDAAVIIDADLQDPLAVIPTMLARYRDGYDIAYGQRMVREGETPFKRGTAWIFYRLMRLCMDIDMPPDTGDFRLVSRRCIDAVTAMPERQLFLRGLFAWTGFSQVAVPYVRHARLYGETKYPLVKMLAFAWRGITAFSVTPIRLVGFFGLGSAALGFVAGAWSLCQALAGNAVQGWTSIMCLLAFLGGMILAGLGVIGEYVGRIYEEVKCRPLYIVERLHNVDNGPQSEPGGQPQTQPENGPQNQPGNGLA